MRELIARGVARGSTMRHRDLAVYALSVFVLGLLLIHPNLKVGDNTRILFTNPWTFLGVVMISASVLGYICMLLWRVGVDRFSLGLLALSGVIGLLYIHVSTNTAYTNDVGGHMRRIFFTSRHWWSPYGFRGLEEHHPPLYYYLGVMITGLAQWFGTLSDWTALRFFSWCCTMVFHAYGLLTIRQAGLSKLGYRTALALFLLWPAMVHQAGKINSEAMFYAMYAASFYYAMVWVKEGRIDRLWLSLLIAGTGFLLRTNVLLLYGLLGVLMLMYWGKQPWRVLLGKRGGVLVAVTLLCFLANISRIWLPVVNPTVHYQFGDSGPAVFGFWHFLSFDVVHFLEHPYVEAPPGFPFWNFTLNDFLYSGYKWGDVTLPRFLNLQLVLVILFGLLPWLAAKPEQLRGMRPYAVMSLLSFVALMIFATWKGMVWDQEARYIYQVLPCLVILFGRAVEIMEVRGWPKTAWAAVVLVACFSFSGTVLFLVQWR